MTTEKIQEKLNQGFFIKVQLVPNKKHDAMKLQTLLLSNETNVVYPIYYNHCKSFLNNDQIDFINTYNNVKNWAFKNDVEMNVKFKSLSESNEDIKNRVMRTSIKKMEYLEQL